VTEKIVAKTKKRKKTVIKVTKGIIHVHSTFNNTIVTVSDQAGRVICWSSAGTAGFKGSRKSTPFLWSNKYQKSLLYEFADRLHARMESLF